MKKMLMFFLVVASMSFGADYLVFQTKTSAEQWVEDFGQNRYLPDVQKTFDFKYDIPRQTSSGTWAVFINKDAKKFLLASETSSIVDLTQKNFISGELSK